MRTLGQIFLSIILDAVGIAISGLCFMNLYRWFMVVPFDLPNLSYAACVGVVFFIASLRYKPYVKNEEFNDVIGKWIVGIIVALLTLLTGWIIHLLIA